MDKPGLIERAWIVKSIRKKISDEKISESNAVASFDLSLQEFRDWEAQLKAIDLVFPGGTLEDRPPLWAWRSYINMSIGIGLLLFSWYLFEKETHSSLIFMVAILGVAVFLYGTGSQSSGSLRSSNSSSAIYDVSIAGGAGVLAILIGYGILMMETKVKQAFLGQYEVVALNIEAEKANVAAGTPNFSRFVPIVYKDGMPLAAMHRQGSVYTVHIIRPTNRELKEFNLTIGLQAIGASSDSMPGSEGSSSRVPTYLGFGSACRVKFVDNDEGKGEGSGEGGGKEPKKDEGRKCIKGQEVIAVRDSSPDQLTAYNVKIWFDTEYVASTVGPGEGNFNFSIDKSRGNDNAEPPDAAAAREALGKQGRSDGDDGSSPSPEGKASSGMESGGQPR